jgi:hypothetical protein
MTNVFRYFARSWYYFRVGYSTYLTFLLGYVTTLVTLYYLAVKNIPYLLDIFPHFVPFVLVGTVLGAPLSVAIGWLHIKRTPAYTSEADVGVEANPYNYKLTPGKETEILMPLYLELLAQLKHLNEAQNLLNEKDRHRIEDLEKKIQVLMQGGYVGTPRRKL